MYEYQYPGIANQSVQYPEQGLWAEITGIAPNISNAYGWIQVKYDADAGYFTRIDKNDQGYFSEITDNGLIFSPARDINRRKKIRLGSIQYLTPGALFTDSDGNANRWWDFGDPSPQLAKFYPLQDIIPRSCIGYNGDEIFHYRLSGILIDDNVPEWFYPEAYSSYTYFNSNNPNLVPKLSFGIIKALPSPENWSPYYDNGMSAANFGTATWDNAYSLKSPATNEYDGAWKIINIYADNYAKVNISGDFYPDTQCKFKLLDDNLTEDYYLIVTNPTYGSMVPSGTILSVSWKSQDYQWHPFNSPGAALISGVQTSGSPRTRDYAVGEGSGFNCLRAGTGIQFYDPGVPNSLGIRATGLGIRIAQSGYDIPDSKWGVGDIFDGRMGIAFGGGLSVNDDPNLSDVPLMAVSLSGVQVDPLSCQGSRFASGDKQNWNKLTAGHGLSFYEEDINNLGIAAHLQITGFASDKTTAVNLNPSIGVGFNPCFKVENGSKECIPLVSLNAGETGMSSTAVDVIFDAATGVFGELQVTKGRLYFSSCGLYQGKVTL